jgi:hypothetical protein
MKSTLRTGSDSTWYALLEEEKDQRYGVTPSNVYEPDVFEFFFCVC